MRLTGPERRKLRRILNDAFDRDDLTSALALGQPSRDFESLVSEGSFSNQLFKLIKEAEKNGWLDEFPALLEKEREGRGDLITQARAIVERARRRADNEKRKQGKIERAAGSEAAGQIEIQLVRYCFLAILVVSFLFAVGKGLVEEDLLNVLAHFVFPTVFAPVCAWLQANLSS